MRCSAIAPRTSTPGAALVVASSPLDLHPQPRPFSLNAVENFFSRLTRQRIRRGLRSIVDRQGSINACLAEHNAHPKPFVWTKSVEAIVAKLDRVPVLSD